VPAGGAIHSVRWRFGNSPGLPRRRSARSWLPGWRTESYPLALPWSAGPDWTKPENLARAAVERREASASAKSGARRDERTAGGNACLRDRGLDYAPFGAPPPSFRRQTVLRAVLSCRAVAKLGCSRIARTRHCERSKAIQGRSRWPWSCTGLLRRYAPRNDAIAAI